MEQEAERQRKIAILSKAEIELAEASSRYLASNFDTKAEVQTISSVKVPSAVYSLTD